CRRASLLLSCFLVTNATMAAAPSAEEPPAGFWELENSSDDMPYGGLKLDRANAFTLLMYDSNCLLYTINGPMKKKSAHTWELKHNEDYSNTFLLTKKEKKLELIDTEGQKMVFSAASEAQLTKGINQQCRPPSDIKPKPALNTTAGKGEPHG
ncbi:MAG: hypothetical protein ACPG5T_07500, partial [Endozoicomonas sp.]